jgi:opacity protein-like surface antigen
MIKFTQFFIAPLGLMLFSVNASAKADVYLATSIGYYNLAINYNNQTDSFGNRYFLNRIYSGSGLTEHIALGMTYPISNYFIGLQLEWEPFKLNATENFIGGQSNSALTFKQSYADRVLALFGKNLTNQTRVYLGVGESLAQWSADAYNQTNPREHDIVSKLNSGTTFEIGMNTLVSQHISVGLNLKYTRYQHFEQTVNTSIFFNQIEEYQPKVFFGGIKFTYHFK